MEETSTSIQTAQSKNNTILDIYDLNGKKLDKPQKGLNILLMNDGTTKKVIVKDQR